MQTYNPLKMPKILSTSLLSQGTTLVAMPTQLAEAIVWTITLFGKMEV